MEVVIQGKNNELTDLIRYYAEKKINTLDRYLPDGTVEAHVELSDEQTRSAADRQVAQVTLRINGAILRAEERSGDIFASIDAVSEKMIRQIRRYKGRRWESRRNQAAETAEAIKDATPEEEEGEIVRIKRFTLSPTTEDEAISQMELLGHDFYVFYNVNTESINVLYRRHDGNYGLLQPEMP